MKHRHIIALALTLLAGLFTACEEKEPEPDYSNRFSFFATLGEGIGTKTVYIQSESLLNWSPKDEIHVFYGKTSGRFVSTNTSEEASAIFKGELPGLQEVSSNELFWAVYPYTEDQTYDGSSITVTLPATQTAIAGTFDNDYFISVARSDSPDLIFYNVCGGYKLSVALEGIKKIVFRGKNNEPLAGKVKVGFHEDLPEVKEVLEGETSITLNAPDGESFVPGTWYYLVTLPALLSKGYVIELYGDSLLDSQEVNTSLDISRSSWDEVYEIGDIDEPFTGLRINPVEDGVVTISNPLGLKIEYSKDAQNWTISKENPIVIPVSVSDTLCLRGNNPAYAKDEGATYTNIQFSSDCYVYGNLMSLITPKRYNTLNTLPEPFTFTYLFAGNSHLLNSPIEDLCLPATSLNEYCYLGMFSGCTKLITAPELPATILSPFCYKEMFKGCTGLTAAPELRASLITKETSFYCYESMFEGCSSLQKAPELPSRSVFNNCYRNMFKDCTRLTTAPELPATSLEGCCYEGMFSGCISLTTAPELPAKSLNNTSNCYAYMFAGCTSLSIPPELPATVLGGGCYLGMFENCTRLTTAPELPVTLLWGGCYESMFSGCISLTTAPELPATSMWSELVGYASRCYAYMFAGCTSLIKAPELPATLVAFGCYQGMFLGCTSLTMAPELPASNFEWADPSLSGLVAGGCCYKEMFKGCTSLITAPSVLPATTLFAFDYEEMFYGCENLTNAPELLATRLAGGCYHNMFYGCKSLTNAPALPATTFVNDDSFPIYPQTQVANDCYKGMFYGCESLTTAPDLPATTLAKGCYEDMFKDCTSLITAPSVLPATILDEECYFGMFANTNITITPVLPATTLAKRCYEDMFRGTKITTAPALPAKILAESCYAGMFYECKELTSAPALPATILAEACYTGMFKYCNNMLEAPDLPASRLEKSCYSGMFSNSGIKAAPELPAITLAPSCYKDMFHACWGLTEAPDLPATQLVEKCYDGMFTWCVNINSIKALFTTTPGPEYTSKWVQFVAADGTFVKNPDATWDVTGPDGIPEGWTVVYD